MGPLASTGQGQPEILSCRQALAPSPPRPNMPVKGGKTPVTKLSFKLSPRAMSLNPASATRSEILILCQRIKSRRLSVHFEMKQVRPRRFRLLRPRAHSAAACSLWLRGAEAAGGPSSLPPLLGGETAGHCGDGNATTPLMSNFLKTTETHFIYGLVYLRPASGRSRR